MAERILLFLDDLFYSRTKRHIGKQDWFTQTKEETGLVSERAGKKAG